MDKNSNRSLKDILDKYSTPDFELGTDGLRMLEEARQSALAEVEETIEGLIEYEDYDVMVCSKCERFVRERFSHNSEDGFSECCGKKLKRVQGKKIADTSSNYQMQEVKSLISSKRGEEGR